jgi:hypothetical protein
LATAQSLITSSNYLLNFIVSWIAPNGTVPVATSPLSLSITNANLLAGMKVYAILSGQVTALGTVTTNGSITVALSQDPLIVAAPTVPDAPTITSVAPATSTSVLVSWSAPLNNGGASITTFSVTSNTGQSCSSGSNSCSITSLSVGTAYTFSVTATNSVGVSVPSLTAPGATPSLASQAALSVTSVAGTYGTTLTLTHSGGSGTGAVSYATSTTGCSIAADQLTTTGAVTCSIVATQAADLNFNAATSSPTDVIISAPPSSVKLQPLKSNGKFNVIPLPENNTGKKFILYKI